MSKTPQLDVELSNFATGREILAQPGIWRDWIKTLTDDLKNHREWIRQSRATEILLCGAGTSAFIGDLVASALGKSFELPLRSVPSTDLVASPRKYLRSDTNPLVISFGRSGNSAESIGTMDALDALAPNAPRLNITCNADSALATRPPISASQRVITLPAATCDTGFAMTSSFTTMLLTALALLDKSTPDCNILSNEADRLLPELHHWASQQPIAERIVFVGSGALTHIARESALKIMELTGGKTPVLWDSALGFRHGPKSFVTPQTHVISLISSDPYTACYDNDLANELCSQFPTITQTTIGPGPGADIRIKTDMPDHWNAVLYVLAAQVLSVHWSAAFGLNVDDPFAGQGTLTRVVSGVKLYPPEEA